MEKRLEPDSPNYPHFSTQWNGFCTEVIRQIPIDSSTFTIIVIANLKNAGHGYDYLMTSYWAFLGIYYKELSVLTESA